MQIVQMSSSNLGRVKRGGVECVCAHHEKQNSSCFSLIICTPMKSEGEQSSICEARMHTLHGCIFTVCVCVSPFKPTAVWKPDSCFTVLSILLETDAAPVLLNFSFHRCWILSYNVIFLLWIFLILETDAALTDGIHNDPSLQELSQPR